MEIKQGDVRLRWAVFGIPRGSIRLTGLKLRNHLDHWESTCPVLFTATPDFNASAGAWGWKPLFNVRQVYREPGDLQKAKVSFKRRAVKSEECRRQHFRQRAPALP